MLAPRPPLPVARRREVAAMVVQARQAVAIAPGHVLLVRATPAADAGHCPGQAPDAGHCRVPATPPQFEAPAPGAPPLD